MGPAVDHLDRLIDTAAAGAAAGGAKRQPQRRHLRIVQPLALSPDLNDAASQQPDEVSADRHDRLQRLMARLAVEGQVRREDLAHSMWPSLSRDRALAMLRVNLAHLNEYLEPDRVEGAAPQFIEADARQVRLRSPLSSGTTEFEQKLRHSQRCDRDGRWTDAAVAYGAAEAAFNLDHLVELDDATARTERMRLTALRWWAAVRLGEIRLERTDIVGAHRQAASAAEAGPLDERAHRLLARCLHAKGDAEGAAWQLRALMARLTKAGLGPERATLRLASQHQVRQPAAG